MTYGPTNPSTAPDRSRTSDARQVNLDMYRSWSELWFIGYLVILGLLGATYAINHIFEWGGMITNTFIFLVYAMILAPVLTAPAVIGAVTIVGLFGSNVPQAFKTYLGGIAPNIAFWSLLAVGAMAWFPWHLGTWWAGPLVMAVSLFLVVHTWKYVTDAKIVKTLSLWYAIGVLLVGLAFALGLDKPAKSVIDRVSPPPAYTEYGTNWWINPVTGKVFKSAPQEGCQARGDCYDPNHSSGRGGTGLVPYDAEIVKQLNNNNRRSGTPAAPPAPKAVKVQGCTGLYATALNQGRLTTCKQITLYRGGEAFELMLSSNFCPGSTIAGATRIEKVDPDGNGRDNIWILHPPNGASQATVQVYGVARGETFRRNTCPGRT